MSEIWINDIDLTDYNFVMGVDPKHGGAPSFSDVLVPVAGGLGPIWAGEAAQAAARRMVVGGFFEAATFAQRLEFLDTIKWLSALGAIRLRFADRPDQEYVDGRLIDFTPTQRAAILQTRASDLQITFEFADVLRYAMQPEGYALSATRTPLPTGTGPSLPIFSVHGGGASLSNFSAILCNAAGDPVQTMGFVGTLGANDRLVVNCKEIDIQLISAGVASDGFAFWPPGNGDFLALLASDAAYDQGAWQTMQLTGTGTPFGRITYKRSNI